MSGGGLHYGHVVWWRTLYIHEWKNDMAANVASLFSKGSSPEVKFLGQPQSLGQETWPPENSNSNKIFIFLEKSKSLDRKHAMFKTY